MLLPSTFTKTHLYPLFFVAVISVYFVIQRATNINSVLASEFVVKPQKFTELYFNQPASLPPQFVIGKLNHFSFIIHNQEGQNLTYSYVVYSEINHQLFPITGNEINLPNFSYQTIPVNFILSKNQRSKIVVNLPHQNQSISFWIDPQ
jgi:hypothetical protein